MWSVEALRLDTCEVFFFHGLPLGPDGPVAARPVDRVLVLVVAAGGVEDRHRRDGESREEDADADHRPRVERRLFAPAVIPLKLLLTPYAELVIF